jgi:hypothetical protein
LFVVRRPVTTLLCLLGACATSPRFEGPLQTRNLQPAQLTVLHLPLRGASPVRKDEARFRLEANYGSMFVESGGGGDTWVMDGELLRTAANCRYGLGGGVEAWLELPFAHTTGGFLDDFVEQWHDALGLPDGGRPAAPENRFLVEAFDDGSEVYSMDREDWTWLDLPVGLSWSPLPLTPERQFGITLHGAVEFPLGNEDRGYGNGGFDAALGLSAELRTGTISWTTQIAHTFARTPGPARRAGFTFEDVTALALGAEVCLSETWALLFQLEGETSTLRDLEVEELEDPALALWVGTRARLGDRVSLELAFGEDLKPDHAPDFMVYTALGLRLGAGRD